MNSTNNNYYFQNADVWQPILWQSTPIAIRALSVTSKTLNQATALFKIDLVLANKDRKWPSSRKDCNIFNDNIISKLTDKNKSANEKICDLKTYMDVDNFDGKSCLHNAAYPRSNEHATFEFLLKLCPNLDLISDSPNPTLLFKACMVDFKENHIRLLIDAGVDWRIKNANGFTAFYEVSRLPLTRDEKIQLKKLIDYSKGYWQQLNRDQTPIPSRAFTFHQNKPNYKIFNV